MSTTAVDAPPIVVDVIVPVLHRPWQAEPFMASVDETHAQVLVVAEPDDTETIAAWLLAGAVVHVSETAHTFAQKANVGYRIGAAPWLLLVGDDARFTDGWLDAALEVASTTRAAVIGTNDEANRRVVRGDHTCHPFIRRTYVDHLGASWDGPGYVCHEGYAHNFVDDEIVTVAKQRGLWAAAPKCVIPHMHPVYGTAPKDATYQLGRSSQERDRAIFNRRLEQYAL
jgi:hypothetical protein